MNNSFSQKSSHMLSAQTQKILSQFFSNVANLELNVEVCRVRLANLQYFEIQSAFKRLDKGQTQNIQSVDVYNFLRENGRLNFCLNDCKLLMNSYNNQDGNDLSFEQFVKLLLPCYDQDLRADVRTREHINKSGNKLEPEVEKAISDLFEVEINFHYRVNSIKQTLLNCPDWNLRAAFDFLDTQRLGWFNQESIKQFFSLNCLLTTQSELDALIQRMDSNGNGRITFNKFCDFLNSVRLDSNSDHSPQSNNVVQDKNKQIQIENNLSQLDNPEVNTKAQNLNDSVMSGHVHNQIAQRLNRSFNQNQRDLQENSIIITTSDYRGNHPLNNGLNSSRVDRSNLDSQFESYQTKARLETNDLQIQRGNNQSLRSGDKSKKMNNFDIQPQRIRPGTQSVNPHGALNNADEAQLANLFNTIIENEIMLEDQKEILADQEDFNLIEGFTLISQMGETMISSNQLFNYLCQNGLHVELSQVLAFTKRFDLDNDQKLLLSDFKRAFTPISPYCKQQLNKREIQFSQRRRSVKYSFLRAKTKELLLQTFKMHFITQEKIQYCIQRTFQSYTFDIGEAFSSVDTLKLGELNIDSLSRFMKKHRFSPNDIELTLLINRFDKYNQGVITFNDFLIELQSNNRKTKTNGNRLQIDVSQVTLDNIEDNSHLVVPGDHGMPGQDHRQINQSHIINSNRDQLTPLALKSNREELQTKNSSSTGRNRNEKGKSSSNPEVKMTTTERIAFERRRFRDLMQDLQHTQRSQDTQRYQNGQETERQGMLRMQAASKFEMMQKADEIYGRHLKMKQFKIDGMIPKEFEQFGDHGYGERYRTQVFGKSVGKNLRYRLRDREQEQLMLKKAAMLADQSREQEVSCLEKFNNSMSESLQRGAIAKLQQKEIVYDKFIDRFVFRHDLMVYRFYDFVISLLCLSSSYLYLYMAAFRDLHTDDSYYFMFLVAVGIEACFAFHMLLQMFKECPSQKDSNIYVQDFFVIFKTYFFGGFIHDFIPLIPLQFSTLKNNRERLFWIIKVYRLIKGFKLLNVSSVIQLINKVQSQRIAKMCQEDEQLAKDMIKDNNRFDVILKMKYLLKMFLLIILILNASYIVGMMWYILCELYEDFVLQVHFVDPQAYAKYENDYFITSYDTVSQTPQENTLMLAYYAFTTLSTVGFGDIHPISDFERIVCVFIFLFGVTVFSYINGVLISIVDSYREFNQDVEEGHLLLKFFGTLKKFNDNNYIEEDFRKKLEVYFEHRWNNDRTIIFQEESDMKLFLQLPNNVRLDLVKEFFFGKLLKHFEKLFCFRNWSNNNNKSFYGWDDQIFQDFMMYILSSLEPIKFNSNQILFDELEDVNEVLFLTQGMFKIGYEINREKKYVIKYKCDFHKQAPLIGAINCTLGQKSQFIYKTMQTCIGYFIRKLKWDKILDDEFKPINIEFKKYIIHQYFTKIKQIMDKAKIREINRQKLRKDIQNFKFVSTLDDKAYEKVMHYEELTQHNKDLENAENDEDEVLEQLNQMDDKLEQLSQNIGDVLGQNVTQSFISKGQQFKKINDQSITYTPRQTIIENNKPSFIIQTDNQKILKEENRNLLIENQMLRQENKQQADQIRRLQLEKDALTQNLGIR